MSLATEESLREARLRRATEKSNRARTRNTGLGNTSHKYIRRGTTKSPYSKENQYS